MTQTDFEPSLSFVTLADDGRTLLLNDDQRYSVRLPMGLSRKKAAEKQKAIESAILDACNSFGVDYISMDNIRQRTKEIMDLLYERARGRGEEGRKKSRPKMAIIEFFPVDDDTLLQDAGVKFIAINEPKLIVDITEKIIGRLKLM